MSTGENEAVASKPSISIRQYILWLPGSEPEEPTSTLVLTTSRNNYVDTRVLLPQDFRDTNSITHEPTILPVNLDLSCLDWAFAGTSSSTFRTRRSSQNSSKSASNASIKPLTPTGDKRDGATHSRSTSGEKVTIIRDCTWTHWVDSRGPISTQTHSDRKVSEGSQLPPTPVTPEGFTDSGTIYTTDRAGESIEKGQLVNEKGVLQDMEELWRDFTPQRLPGEDSIISIALTAENKIFGTKGMVIRIGGWCQGIIRSSNGEIGVERWRYGKNGLLDGLVKRYDDSASVQQHGTWQKIFKLGKMSIPCEATCARASELKEGDSLTQGGLQWTVIEKESL